MHPDGYVEIRDRSKDVIISGGENIASVEVEQVLDSHPAVVESAVVAMPDEKWGEVPVAFVTVRSGHELDEDELTAYLRERLAHFKVPRALRRRRAAADVDRQDPEERAARARPLGVRVRRR